MLGSSLSDMVGWKNRAYNWRCNLVSFWILVLLDYTFTYESLIILASYTYILT